jgi:hypothetical protein
LTNGNFIADGFNLDALAVLLEGRNFYEGKAKRR